MKNSVIAMFIGLAVALSGTAKVATSLAVGTGGASQILAMPISEDGGGGAGGGGGGGGKG